MVADCSCFIFIPEEHHFETEVQKPYISSGYEHGGMNSLPGF